ncbi:MAG: type I-C CRISPR-associated protein Cas8c/Csd1 [Spirochaetaceae bacterium]|nr:type I-C CRISPR-associated protein Cas8c/Csd1 [Spirochaetaceae bacterium]
MILQALYEYAQRKGDALPEDGFELKEFNFLIKIKTDGTFVDLIDMRENKRGHSYTVPKSIGRSGTKSYETTFLLWDHYGYVLNEPKKVSKDSEKPKAISDAEKQNRAFISKINSLPEYVLKDSAVSAVKKFYEKYQKENYESIRNTECWNDCAKIENCNLTFILLGDDEPVVCREVVKDYQRQIISKQIGDSEDDTTEEIVNGICLITGENAVISRLHTSTSISGAKSNAKLVGFQKNSGYDSYGKKQSYNAPVSVKAEAAYTKALKHLINSKENIFRLGNDTVVFWAEKQEAESFESMFSVFFNPDKDSDDPDRNVREVKNLFAAVQTGKYNKSGLDSNFYVLCLSPNAARISVRFWETGKVKTFANRIKQHFDDFEIIRPSFDDKEYLNLYQILSATALQSKMENVAPNLIGSVMQSILKGLPYPVTLQQQCIRRIRAEQKVTRERAAILKAYINRLSRKNKNEEVSVALDRNNENKGYLLGRLFAVFEKVQQETHPGLNATITDRFYGAASTNPVTVFTQLMRLNRHHLSSYENDGLKIVREKEIGEIMNMIDSFPTHLNLNEQSYFAIGYYHEKQSFFEKSNKSEESEGENYL